MFRIYKVDYLPLKEHRKLVGQSEKAPGQDNLNAELFKADPELPARILQTLFTAVWKQESVR